MMASILFFRPNCQSKRLSQVIETPYWNLYLTNFPSKPLLFIHFSLPSSSSGGWGDEGRCVSWWQWPGGSSEQLEPGGESRGMSWASWLHAAVSMLQFICRKSGSQYWSEAYTVLKNKRKQKIPFACVFLKPLPLALGCDGSMRGGRRAV